MTETSVSENPLEQRPVRDFKFRSAFGLSFADVSPIVGIYTVFAIGFCPDEPKATGNTDEDIQAKAKWAVANAGCTNKHKEQGAHDLAVGLVGKIRGGVDFLKMVAEYSEDPDSKATQGDFGLVTRENSFKQEIKDGRAPIGSPSSTTCWSDRERTCSPRDERFR